MSEPESGRSAVALEEPAGLTTLGGRSAGSADIRERVRRIGRGRLPRDFGPFCRRAARFVKFAADIRRDTFLATGRHGVQRRRCPVPTTHGAGAANKKTCTARTLETFCTSRIPTARSRRPSTPTRPRPGATYVWSPSTPRPSRSDVARRAANSSWTSTSNVGAAIGAGASPASTACYARCCPTAGRRPRTVRIVTPGRETIGAPPKLTGWDFRR